MEKLAATCAFLFAANVVAWVSALTGCGKTRFGGQWTEFGPRIGIGGSLTAPPSHTTVHTDHVHGGSLDYAARTTREGRPSAVKKALGRATCMAGVRAIRQGP